MSTDDSLLDSTAETTAGDPLAADPATGEPATGESAAAQAPLGRVARRRDRRVRDILTAAAEVLAERGYQGFVLDEVAERVDLTKASLYHYFPSRDELVSSCLEQLGDSMNERLRTLVADHPGTATEQLTLLITAQLELTTWSRPEMARLFLQPVELPEPYRGRTRRVREQHDEIFRNVVRRGIATGEFGGRHVGDGDIALHNLYGAINHVPIWFRSRRRLDFDRMAAAVAGNALRLFSAPAD
ncbi:MAG TPA: TetR/AcrR family transcriptional regulator [Pseudonocardia sp.]